MPIPTYSVQTMTTILGKRCPPILRKQCLYLFCANDDLLFWAKDAHLFCANNAYTYSVQTMTTYSGQKMPTYSAQTMPIPILCKRWPPILGKRCPPITIVVPGPPETVDIEQGMSQAEMCSPQGERLEVPSYMSAQGCNLKPYCASLSHPFSVVASWADTVSKSFPLAWIFSCKFLDNLCLHAR